MPAPGSAPKWPQFGTDIEKGHTKRKKLPREVCFLNIFSPLTWFGLVVNSFRTGLFARYRFPSDLQETPVQQSAKLPISTQNKQIGKQTYTKNQARLQHLFYISMVHLN